jgi:hypothetical protein
MSGYGSNAPNIPAGSQFDSNAPWNCSGDDDPRCELCGFGLDEDGVCEDCAECGDEEEDDDDL